MSHRPDLSQCPLSSRLQIPPSQFSAQGRSPSGTEKDARPLGGGGPGGLLSGNSGTPAPVRPHAKAQRTSIGPSEP